MAAPKLKSYLAQDVELCASFLGPKKQHKIHKQSLLLGNPQSKGPYTDISPSPSLLLSLSHTRTCSHMNVCTQSFCEDKIEKGTMYSSSVPWRNEGTKMTDNPPGEDMKHEGRKCVFKLSTHIVPLGLKEVKLQGYTVLCGCH